MRRAEAKKDGGDWEGFWEAPAMALGHMSRQKALVHRDEPTALMMANFGRSYANKGDAFN